MGKVNSLANIADGFPTDLAMAALEEEDRLLSKQQVVCVNMAAVFLCLNCEDMCSSCTTAHGKLSVSKYHKVEELSSLTVEKLAGNRPAICAVHEDEKSKVYCPKVYCPKVYCLLVVHHRGSPRMPGSDESGSQDGGGAFSAGRADNHAESRRGEAGTVYQYQRDGPAS